MHKMKNIIFIIIWEKFENVSQVTVQNPVMQPIRGDTVPIIQTG